MLVYLATNHVPRISHFACGDNRMTAKARYKKKLDILLRDKILAEHPMCEVCRSVE
jgi:hypothetical protein